MLSVESGAANVLLPGDIEAVIEQRLLLEGLAAYTLVLVPHHGSAGSSSAAFVRRVAPELAIASAGIGNRFDFPRPEVRRSYRSEGAAFWSTAACGALRLQIGPDGDWRAASARRENRRAWRWPAAADCP